MYAGAHTNGRRALEWHWLDGPVLRNMETPMKTVALLMLLSLPLLGCTDKGPLERGGEKIDNALDDIGAEAKKLGNQIRQELI